MMRDETMGRCKSQFKGLAGFSSHGVQRIDHLVEIVIRHRRPGIGRLVQAANLRQRLASAAG